MNIYRDYGTVNSIPAANNEFEYVRRSQVWQATHDGRDQRLSYRQRSFISFSFGGKQIEDFDLIAYCKGNTMSRKGYASFEDLVTSYDIMDGQYYHGTHYKPNTLSLDLVTDGIDQQKLDEFLHWFSGGQTRELILAEHPNRAIMARVSEPPQLDILPYEKPISILMNGITYTTSTTLYKGTISLNLVSDTPFWYAKQNIFVYNEVNKGVFSLAPLIESSDLFKDAIKVLYEDTIPFSSMVQATMHFGEDQYANVDNTTMYTLVAGFLDNDDPNIPPENWDEIKDIPGYFIYEGNYYYGARCHDDAQGMIGRIAGASMQPENTILTGPITAGDSNYQFFYGGTAPSPTKLSFKMELSWSSSGYIDCIANSYAPVDNKEYSTIAITSQHEKHFDFTTPNVLTSWNKAYDRFMSLTPGEDNWGDLADTLRDQIRHPAVRAFAIGLVTYYQTDINEDGTITSTFKNHCTAGLNKFFTNRSNETSDIEFEFDSEAGTALAKLSYWKNANSGLNAVKAALGVISHNDYYVEVQEDVGDMLRSNWLFIEDHNKIADNQYVKPWSDLEPWNAHKITHNVPADLIDLKIKYKNMYL